VIFFLNGQIKNQKSLVKWFKIKIKNQYFGSDFKSKSKITRV